MAISPSQFEDFGRFWFEFYLHPWKVNDDRLIIRIFDDKGYYRVILFLP